MLIFSIERDHCTRSIRDLDLDSRAFVQVLCAISQLEMRISKKNAVRVSVNIQRLICMNIHCHPMKLLRILYLFIVVVPFHGQTLVKCLCLENGGS